MRFTSTRPQSGLTLVELIVVMAILSILTGLVVMTLGDFYQSNTTSLSQTVQATDTRSVLRSIEGDLITSTGFKTATTMTPVTPTGSDNAAAAWNYTGNDASKPNNRVLISSKYATDKPPSDETRSLIFCNPGGQPLVNNLVYFVARDASTNSYNLYRRIMVETAATGCTATPYQKQSCEATKAWITPCQAVDAVLLYDVDSFTIDYFATAEQQDPIPDQYGAGAASVPSAKSIKITVTTNRLINGVSSPYTSSLRISRLN